MTRTWLLAGDKLAGSWLKKIFQLFFERCFSLLGVVRGLCLDSA